MFIMAKRRNQNNKQHQQQSSQVSHQPAAQSRPQSSAPQTSSHSSGSGKQSVQTISQQRAKHALESVNKYKMTSFQGKLKGYIVSFAPMVLISGFGQACAFYVSKSGGTKEEEKAYDAAHKILWEWLQQTVPAYTNKNDLMDAITQCSASEYQLAQAEALEYLGWVKKFAKAYLQGDDDESTAS